MPEVLLENIVKKYDSEHMAVNNFNLEIDDKEFIVFVGPSGCGKSTTLRMIAGLEEITSGNISIDGKVVNDVAPKDRDIAMVFQNYALYPHMSVHDNMAFSLKLKRISKKEIKSRVENAADILGLTNFLSRKPKELSGGQRQRVALGRAIVRDAKVFLMDEPLSNLDAKLRVQMRAEIQKLHHRLGTTSIYVTHDQTEAMTMATRLVVMKDGLIQQVGKPKEVYDAPQNKFVASFIGSPAMNFLTGQIINGYFIIDELKIKVPKQIYELLERKDYENKEITLGIRPENITYLGVRRENANTNSFPATVGVSELMGADTLLYLDINKQNVACRINDSVEIQFGSRVNVQFDMSKVHFFDIETEEVIQ